MKLAAAVLFPLAALAQLTSPDGAIQVTFDARPDALTYSVAFHGKPVLEPGALQLDLEGQRPLGPGMQIVASHPSSGRDDYKPIGSKSSEVHDPYNALTIDLAEPSGFQRQLQIEARAYNGAFAFRYNVPAQPRLREYRLIAEDTDFKLAKDGAAYALQLDGFRTMYESEFLKLPVSSFNLMPGGTDRRLIGMPFLAELPGAAWIAITEADLKGNAAIYLTVPGGHALRSRISPSIDGATVAVTASLPHSTAWRVVMIADQPGRFIESNVVLDLNPPSQIADTSWIHPGKSAWDWWSGSLDAHDQRAFTTANMKSYVDFAAANKLEYMLLDAGWSARGDLTKMNGAVDVPALAQYAKSKNVKLWIWCYWSELDAQLEEALAAFENWGVSGVKTDFMSRDDQAMIEFYYRTAEAAARHHIMMDYHGATKPTGMERTWPNVLGYEAVLGMEQAKWSTRDDPTHRLTLPFTRMIAGPMDYTPGGFDNVTREEFIGRNLRPEVLGTRAQQLAMYVVYQSPFQMVSDSPHTYQDQPAFQFIADAPAAWDESHVLNGLPGEYITVVRRNGNNWFLGAMTGWTPRKLQIPLSFLGPGRYRAEIYADADDAAQFPKNVSIRKQTVNRASTFDAALAPAGGLAIRFVPIE